MAVSAAATYMSVKSLNMPAAFLSFTNTVLSLAEIVSSLNDGPKVNTFFDLVVGDGLNQPEAAKIANLLTANKDDFIGFTKTFLESMDYAVRSIVDDLKQGGK